MSDRPSKLNSPVDTHDSAREDRLVAAMEECRAALDAGQSIDRQELLRQYDDIADELVACLAGMELVQGVAKQVIESPDDERMAGLASAHTARTLGDFQIVREIGRGGMGVVYEAEQTSLGRAVALKVLPYAAILDDRQLQRFKNEARAAATLNHPNIVPVHFVGAERSVHFYAMQLIEGQSLAEIVAHLRNEIGDSESEMDRSLSSGETVPIAALSTEYSSNPKRYFRSVAEIGNQIAMALGHAHEHGILHRDVKPSNILIDKLGKPWITDFGLARIETEGSITVSGDLLGTLRYMSPEQASGNRQLVDHRADVYSLGATLYELATLRPAFDGRTREELFRQITSQQLTSPRKINPSMPLELETIMLKAMETDPAERYASAQELAEDLGSFLINEPIKARRPSRLVRCSKWARRHIGLFVSSTLVLAVTLLATFMAFYLMSRERTKTVAALGQAEENFDFAIQAVDDMYLELATRWIDDGTAPTLIQEEFLHRARFFYERVAQQPVNTPQDRTQAARVYERIGQIEHFLENYGQADKAFQRAIEFGEALVSVQPSNNNLRRQLPRRYRLRGDTLLQLADVPEATKAYEAGLGDLEILREQDILTIEEQLEQVYLNHGRAALFLRAAQIGQAESHIRDARQLISESPKESSLSARFRIADLNNRRLMARTLLVRGDLPAARAELESTLRRLRNDRDWFLGTDLETMRLETQLLELAGEIVEAEGDFAQAVEHYRESLEIQRQNLKTQKEPSLVIVTTWFKGEKGLIEPAAFCDYIETQQRLARVLLKLGRPYEAEYRLGQCMLTLPVISALRPDVLRYRIAEANTWAFASQVIRERRPNEAKVALDHALVIWRDTLAGFLHAADYQSGVHGLQNDLTWYRSLLDEEGQTQLASDAPQPARTGARSRPKIAFCRDASGRSWFDADKFKMAVGFLKQSAELRESDHAYAWLHLARAHVRLGDTEVAQQYLNKANDQLGTEPNPHPEIKTLQTETIQVIRTSRLQHTTTNP